MQIAVDARFLQMDSKIEHQNFTGKVILELANAHKSHRFLFFSDTTNDAKVNLPENISLITIRPTTTNVLFHKLWYNVRMPSALKKYKADVFISAYGICNTTPTPQLLILEDSAFLSPSFLFHKSKPSNNKKAIVRSLKKATMIAAFSDFKKKEVVVDYNLSEDKIARLGIAAETSFKPAEWEERENIKEKYAAGCEYFVFTAGLNSAGNLINILKAFSIFKKWQKTNMKLVVAIYSNENKDQVEKLSSYKYKDEVILIENEEVAALSKLTAGAYAVVFLPISEDVGTAVLEAMQCATPVITSANSVMSEIAGDAALYCNPANPQEIAEQMKLIFKDEQLRNKLIEAGKTRVKEFTWDKTITSLWEVIQKTVSR